MAAYLTRTLGTPTSNKKGTVSVWVKFSAANSTSENIIFGGYSDTNNRLHIGFENSQIYVNNRTSSSVDVALITTRLFRDPSAWYHIVVAVDTAQGSSSDRVKLYVNGVQETAFGTETYPAADAVFQFFVDGNTSAVGRNQGGTTFDGVMAHAHYCDGQAYAASDFGETDSTSGIWVAKTSPSVTYGNNGFFLKFQDTSAFGDDSSGNTNDYTLSGTITQTKDTPDNNFCTMNPLDNYYQSATFSNGNNTVLTDTSKQNYSTATIGVSSGKWYWEVEADTMTGGDHGLIGIASQYVTSTSEQELGEAANNWAYYAFNGKSYNNATYTTYGDTYTAGDIVGIALDLTNNKLYFSKNGTWQDSGDPTSGATGTGALSITAASSTTAGVYLPAVSEGGSSETITAKFNFGNGYFGTTAVTSAEADGNGEGQFEYAPPTGYFALCTNNLGSES